MGRVSQKLGFKYTQVDRFDDLTESEKETIIAAKEVSSRAYAPYSKFNVGAAARLSNGEIVAGSNKENASFPAGTCAERNVLNVVSDTHPKAIIESMAIYGTTEEFDIEDVLAPCGICRQVLCETEKLQKSALKLIFQSYHGGFIVIECCEDLLPFHFYLTELKK